MTTGRVCVCVRCCWSPFSSSLCCVVVGLPSSLLYVALSLIFLLLFFMLRCRWSSFSSFLCCVVVGLPVVNKKGNKKRKKKRKKKQKSRVCVAAKATVMLDLPPPYVHVHLELDRRMHKEAASLDKPGSPSAASLPGSPSLLSHSKHSQHNNKEIVATHPRRQQSGKRACSPATNRSLVNKVSIQLISESSWL